MRCSMRVAFLIMMLAGSVVEAKRAAKENQELAIDAAGSVVEVKALVKENEALKNALQPLVSHATALLERFATKAQVSMSESEVVAALASDTVLNTVVAEHMVAEAAGKTKTDMLLRNDLRRKLVERANVALEGKEQSLDASVGGKTQCMCAINHFNGHEMVDLETKFDYTQGPMGDYQNGKMACANALTPDYKLDCIYRCQSDLKYGMDAMEGMKVGVDQTLPFGQQYTASRCNMDGRCECMDVTETVRKVDAWFGGQANLVSDHPIKATYFSAKECLQSCDCSDGGGVDQEGLCIDEFNTYAQPQAAQYQFRTAPQYSFEQL